jgi:hypothetical protein
MVIAHRAANNEQPLIIAIGDYSDSQFSDSVWGLRDLLEVGLNASLPKKFQGMDVFDVQHGTGGRVEHRLTPEGQASVIRTAKSANDTQAVIRVTGVLVTPRKYADLVTLSGEVMFGDGTVMPGIAKMSVRPMIRAHNRWQEEAGYAESLKELNIGHYYTITLAGPRREYIAKLDLGNKMTTNGTLVVVLFKSISDRDGNVVCYQDMEAEPMPTPEGERNSVTGEKHFAFKGNRFYRAINDLAIDRFQSNWDLVMGTETVEAPAEETPEFNADTDSEGEEAGW